MFQSSKIRSHCFPLKPCIHLFLVRILYALVAVTPTISAYVLHPKLPAFSGSVPLCPSWVNNKDRSCSRRTTRRTSNFPSCTALFAKKKSKSKRSPASSSSSERRRRKKKEDLLSFVPEDHSSYSKKISSSSAPVDEEVSTATEDINSKETKAKASNLIQAQKKSVATLTHIKQCVDSVNYEELTSSLVQRGYVVVDDFLKSSQDTTTTTTTTTTSLVDELCVEGISMLQNGKLQLEQLGSGVYSTLLTGGGAANVSDDETSDEDENDREDTNGPDTTARYVDSPRCVEYIVSMTKNLPPLFNSAMHDVLSSSSSSSASAANDNDNDKWRVDVALDDGASMGVLRTFDANAKRASLNLLSPSSGQQDQKPIPGPIGSITEGDSEDARILSMVYYLTPETWKGSTHGGSLRFYHEDEVEMEVVEPKRDRLVLFWSGETRHGEDEWLGPPLQNDDDNAGKGQESFGSCLVLHLVRKR